MGEPLIEKSLHTGRAHQPRKLIVCVDGTSNQFSEKNTHVVELYSRIIKDPTQLTYYNSGVGTYAPPFWWSLKYQWQKVTNAIDLMIAWNFDRVILGAYRWLSDTYQPGDQIFLFGFSRGAYQVGLIHPGNQEQIPFAWAIYSKNNSELTQLKFKEAFCRESVDLHFIGVWDTVASVGVVPRKPFPLSDQCGHITHFRHALALDECRVKFLPEHISTENTAYKKNRSLKEVWFTGTHSDIGGGNKANPNLDRGGEPLKWMMEEASVMGLSVRLHDVMIGSPHATVTNSMQGLLYLSLEVMPFLQWREYRCGKELSPSTSLRPHMMKPREVLPHQTIHWTVAARLQAHQEHPEIQHPYIPKAKLLTKHDIIKWDTMKIDNNQPGKPAYTGSRRFIHIVNLLKDIPETPDPSWFDQIRNYSSGDGRGEPETLWAYGGPQLFQKLFEDYPDKSEVLTVVHSIIGYDIGLRWEAIDARDETKTQNQSEEALKKEQVKRLQYMIVPRACIILQWLKDSSRKNLETSLSNKAVDSKAEQQKINFWSWIRGKIGYYFPTANTKMGKTDAEESSEDTRKLSQLSIPLDHGSIKLATAIARLAVKISTEPTYQLAHGEPLNGGIAKLSALLVEVLELVHNNDHVAMESIATWRQSEVDLVDWILTAVTYLNPNDAAKETFYQLKIGRHLSPLIRSKNIHPDLAMTALYLVTTLSHEPRFGTQMANSDVVPAITEILKGEFDLNNPMKQPDLVRISLQAAAGLSKYADCRTTLGEKGIISHLFQLLDEASFTIDSLKVLKNISTEFPEQFEEHNIEILAKYMDEHADASIILANIVDSPGFDTKRLEVYGQYEIATKARGLIRCSDDGRVQVIVRLLRSLVKAVTRAIPFDDDKIFSFKLSDLSQEIVDSLSNSSEHSTNQLLTVILAIAIKEPLLDDVPNCIADLASQGNKWAILVALALLSHREDCQENINEYFKKFRKVIKRLDILNEEILPDMMTVLTTLVKKDHLQPSFRRDVTGMSEYIVIGAYLGTLYASNTETDSSREYVTLAALDLIERLYADAEVRKECSPSEVIGVIHLKLDSKHVSLNIKTRVETMLNSLSQYDNIKEKILHAREMAAVHSD